MSADVLTPQEREYLLSRAAVNGPDAHAYRLSYCLVKLLRLHGAALARIDELEFSLSAQVRETARLRGKL